ncbi:MAG: ferredoxin [Rhizomicrobium sp.]
MKIVVNWTLCDGNGNCAKEAPELLAMDKDDTPQILKENFGEEHRAKAEAAVRCCPKNALSLAE